MRTLGQHEVCGNRENMLELNLDIYFYILLLNIYQKSHAEAIHTSMAFENSVLPFVILKIGCIWTCPNLHLIKKHTLCMFN